MSRTDDLTGEVRPKIRRVNFREKKQIRAALLKMMDVYESGGDRKKIASVLMADPKDTIGDAGNCNVGYRDGDLKLIGRSRGFLPRVEEALIRLDSGNFGICSECGFPIEPARLIARPTTEKCVECKAEEEALEKRGIRVQTH